MLDTRHDVSPHTNLAQGVRVPVVLIRGDGVGPEVADAARRVLSSAFAGFDWIEADAGAAVMEKGVRSGLPQSTLDEIESAGLVLKGPLATPIGMGGKSANVTLRKLYELYGNIRPIQPLPGVPGPFSGRDIDFTVIRENVEDLYAGVEHMQTPDVAQCLKLITRKGSEKIAKLAFAHAASEGRKSVHVVTKANIMKLTEGLFKRSAEMVSQRYPGVELKHMLVDNCAQQMVLAPEQFEVIVATNMNGDILSDLGAGLIGGLGLTPSANVGDDVAVFEAVHGSAPDIAGAGVANPTALIRSGVMMLRHIGEADAASRVEQALAQVYEDGVHLTQDIMGPEKGVSTEAFCDALVDALAQIPPTSPAVRMASQIEFDEGLAPRARTVQREFVGADVFVEWSGDVEALAAELKAALDGGPFHLSMISNRGTLVWPQANGRPDTVDHWRCRLTAASGDVVGEDRLPDALTRISKSIRWMHVEKLETLNGEPGYSLAQGQS